MPYTQRCLAGFCAGAGLLALPWPGPTSLPAAVAVLAAAMTLAMVVGVLLCSVRGRTAPRAALPVLAMLAGLCWSAWVHQRALDARLVTPPAGQTASFVARVEGHPAALRSAAGELIGQRFEVRTVEAPDATLAGGGMRLRLSWYGAQRVERGSVWRWTAVLEGPWSYANPGGFDYERWLLGADIQATGYVRQAQQVDAPDPGPGDRIRALLAARIAASGADHEPVLRALLLGDGAAISADLWQVLRSTGTVHLLVISGLHVSLAAAGGFLLGRMLARLCPVGLLWLDARLVGCLVGMLAAGAYVQVAGAGIPALRALAMAVATLCLLAGGRSSRLGGALLLALAGLLAADPLAVHRQGTWLSFAAVALLYLALGRSVGEIRIWTLVRAQLALSLGLLPLLALFTGTVPWSGAAANLIAVPLVSIVVVPALLLAGCCAAVPGVALPLLGIADFAAGIVLAWLDLMSGVPLPLRSGGGLACSVAQLAAALLLIGVPRRWGLLLALALALPLAPVTSGLRHGEFRLIAFDVGQGAAVVIDTARHRLLYDAGPAFPSGFDTGRAVVGPGLSLTGVAHLDALVLSHDDIDHVGGAPYVRAAFAPKRVFAPGGSGDAGDRPCGGERWEWDGVKLHLLALARPVDASDNDRSCVLLVDDGLRRALLPGDIGRRVETALLRRLADGRGADLVMAPHHGSSSSSSLALLRVLRPSLALVSAGRGNRFGHPHPEVVQRYQSVGSAVLQTGRHGALLWHSRHPGRVVRWRNRPGAPYWRAADDAVSSSTLP